MNDTRLWQSKLAARLHAPAEKAFALLRDPANRAQDSTAPPRPQDGDRIGADKDAILSPLLFSKGVDRHLYQLVQRADNWAAAADRPQWPTHAETGGSLPDWANAPLLIHPLSGAQFNPGDDAVLMDKDGKDIGARACAHFSGLLDALGIQDADSMTTDQQRKALLALWRFGPELLDTQHHDRLGMLWRMLPADTRTPDQSIWDHLDLTSAFAGAFAADPDGEAALLALSIGPVQPFIAAARSTSDLWAGSHLLSRLAWEAMRPVCENFGPDAIIFPRLRGVPQTDLWLRDQMDLPDALFEQCEWNRGSTDSNPLFCAALPNRFVAILPRSQASLVAARVEASVRSWLARLGDDVVSRLLHEAGHDVETTSTPYAQMKTQLEGFPEVHWAVVPFSLVTDNAPGKEAGLNTVRLSAAMAPFFGATAGEDCGFLASPAWQLLKKSLRQSDDPHDTRVFLTPNPGVLYPAIHDLAERVVAAAKAVRPFAQSPQHGWRCSLTGESEWLTTDRTQLRKSFRQQTDTLWANIARRKPALAKKGEHLGALPAIKRLWPTIFAEEAGKALAAGEYGEGVAISRFVVSTHTMALAYQLDQWLAHGNPASGKLTEALQASAAVALPRRLVKRHARHPALDEARKLPALLDDSDNLDETAQAEAQRSVCQTLGVDMLEAYYSLLLMDGDRMGQMLSGDEKYAVTYRESVHPQFRPGFDRLAERHPAIRQYADQKRALSPGRHLAISGALNDFSLNVVRHVVEEEHLGRVIYAGGDDVLAMLPVADLLPAMQRLRCAYSGVDPAHEGGRDPRGLTLAGGFAILKDKTLMRMMGECATASCGAVIAHHQAPLIAVRRELDAAEKRAKKEGGRDAFSITIIKRSGGLLRLTAKWGEPLALLVDLRDFLSDDTVSRRAVYNTREWLVNLPEPTGDGAMLASLLAYQMARQTHGQTQEAMATHLARRLTAVTLLQAADRLDWLGNFMNVAEFLARETRRPSVRNTQGADA